MFSWFRSKPVCPIDPAIQQWIDSRWDWLTEQFGQEFLRSRKVILPRSEFFPDPFHGTEEDAHRMFERVCIYMHVDVSTVELSIYKNKSQFWRKVPIRVQREII